MSTTPQTDVLVVCVCGWMYQASDTAIANKHAADHRAERGHERVKTYPMSELSTRALPDDSLMDTIARCVRQDLID